MLQVTRPKGRVDTFLNLDPHPALIKPHSYILSRYSFESGPENDLPSPPFCGYPYEILTGLNDHKSARKYVTQMLNLMQRLADMIHQGRFMALYAMKVGTQDRQISFIALQSIKLVIRDI